MLKDDDFNLNLNLESCMNIPGKKQKKTETITNTTNNETLINESKNNDIQYKKI